MLNLCELPEQSVEHVTDVVQSVPQERIAPLREGQNFSMRFMEGVANVVVDFRVEDDDSLLRMWLAFPAKPLAVRVEPKFPVYVCGEENETDDVERRVLADVGFENRYGTEKPTGLGVFMSVFSQRLHEITPPFWWTTGNPRVDASARRRQIAEHSRNGGRGSVSDHFRYLVGSELWDTLLAVRVFVYPYGVVVEPRDSRLKLVDTFVGPFNSR